MTVLFIQLPTQDATGEGAAANVPLAAGSIMAYAFANGLLRRDECALLDQATADYGGDAAVVSAVMAAAPALVAFTLFPWNLDRSVWLARRLRGLMPATHFIAGGPEAAPGMALFKAQAFDALVEGEGEAVFGRLLEDAAHRALKPRYAADSFLDPALLPNPYLEGILPVSPDKPVYAETVRGAVLCPLLSGAMAGAPAPRYFPRDLAPRLLRLASDGDAREFKLLDPALDRRPDLVAFVKSLAAANEEGVPLLADMDPGAVTEETARLLADAALASVDAPLPTTNPAALAALGLSLDKDAFERGAQLLWAQGAVVKPALTLGLPHDSYETTVDTFDFLGMAGLGQDAELSPLVLAPGSALRARSTEFGIREFLEKPPYWVIETDWMDEDDFLDSVADFEESFDVAWGSPVVPNFKRQRNGFTAFADLRDPASLDALLVSPEKLASSVTVLLDADDPERAARAARMARDLRRENPWCLWQVVLHSDAAIPGDSIVSRMADAFSQPEHYFELSRLYSMDPQPSFQTRLFFATSSEALALRAIREHQRLETLFALGDRLPGPKLLEALPFLAFDREAASFELLYDVMSAYRSYPDLLVEAPRELFFR